MRFSYIDSQGKEIEVDSVESLALRIELGAIEPDTRMYDAVADRWAPAEEHPVFRSLSRGEELTEEDVVHIGAEEEPESGAPTDGDEAEATGEDREPEGDRDSRAEAQDGDDPLGLDFQVTMADEEEGASEEGGDAETEGDVFDFEGFDADSVAFEDPEEEGPEVTEGPAASDETVDPSPGAGYETAEGGGIGPPSVPKGGDAPPWAAEGGDLFEEDDEEEPGPMAESEAGGTEPDELQLDDGADGELPPWAREAPAWDEPEEPAAAPEGGGGAGVPPAQDPPEEVPEVDGRRVEGPVRPADWEARKEARERREKLRKVAAGVVLVAACGVAAAYVAGVGVLPGVGRNAVTEEPLVPELPGPLRSALDVAGDEAWAEAVEAARPDEAVSRLPPQPPEAWLEGIYLSTAGEYPGVASYWNGLGDAVATTRERAEERFRAELRVRLDRTSGIDGQRERLLGVGLQELELSTTRRETAVRRILGVVDAALILHELLVARQDDIAYEPYSAPGVSRDPVLEAVPETEGLREEMNSRLDRVLEAIAESGITRPITTEATVDRLMVLLRDAGWRYRPGLPRP